MLFDHNRCGDRCEPDRDRHFQAMYVDQLDFPRAKDALRLRLTSYGVRMIRAERAPEGEQDWLPKRERWHVVWEGKP